jgi:hypothetical protein
VNSMANPASGSLGGLGSRIADLPGGLRQATEFRYRWSKVLMAIGVGLVIAPAGILILLTPAPGRPSQSHLLPFELYVVCFAAGVVAVGSAVATLSRVRRTLSRARDRGAP